MHHKLIHGFVILTLAILCLVISVQVIFDLSLPVNSPNALFVASTSFDNVNSASFNSAVSNTGYYILQLNSDQIDLIENTHFSVDKYIFDTDWDVLQNESVIASTNSSGADSKIFFTKFGGDWFIVVNNLSSLTNSKNEYELRVTFIDEHITKTGRIVVEANDSELKSGVCTSNMYINSQLGTCYSANSNIVLSSEKQLQPNSFMQTSVIQNTSEINELKEQSDDLREKLIEQTAQISLLQKQNEELRAGEDAAIVKIADLQKQVQDLEESYTSLIKTKTGLDAKIVEMNNQFTSSSVEHKKYYEQQLVELHALMDSLSDSFQKKTQQLDVVKAKYETGVLDAEQRLRDAGVVEARLKDELASKVDHLLLKIDELEEAVMLHNQLIDSSNDAIVNAQQCYADQIVPEVPACALEDKDPKDTRTIAYNELLSLSVGQYKIFIRTYSTGLLSFSEEFAIVSLGNRKFSVLGTKAVNELKNIGSVNEAQAKAIELTSNNPSTFDLGLIYVGVLDSSSNGVVIGDDGVELVLITNKLNEVAISSGYSRIAVSVLDPDMVYALKGKTWENYSALIQSMN